MVEKNKDKLITASSKILAALLMGYAKALRRISSQSNTQIGKLNTETPKQIGGKTSITAPGGASDIALKVASEGGKTVANLARDMIDGFLPTVEKAISGKYANMNPEEASKNFHEIIDRQTAFLMRISEDPELLQKLEEWAKMSAEVGVQVLATVRPTLDEMLEEFWEAANSVVTKSVRAGINTGFNIGKTAASAIPVAGGMIVLFISFVQGVNEGMLATAPAVKAGTKNTVKASQIGNQVRSDTDAQLKRVKKAGDELKAAINVPVDTTITNKMEQAGQTMGKNVMKNAVKNAQDKTTENVTANVTSDVMNANAQTNAMDKLVNNPQSTPTSVGGGNIITPRLLRKRILETSKRLEKTIKRFTRARHASKRRRRKHTRKRK